MSAPAAAPRRILVVEDEMLVAMSVEDALSDAGYRVMGPVARVARALELIAREPPDAAVLDVNLSGEPAFPVAEALRRRGIPFLFLTGYAGAALADGFADVPALSKPFAPAGLQAALAALLAASA